MKCYSRKVLGVQLMTCFMLLARATGILYDTGLYKIIAVHTPDVLPTGFFDVVMGRVDK